MLTELRIVNVGVITEASLELSPGLTAISGETGAGKTMVVTGLGLLLGDRADAGIVRIGQDRALIEGRFTDCVKLMKLLDECGAELDGEELLAARSVQSSGRSRAWLGGSQVPIGVLGETLSELATIHGQSEQIRLSNPARQREVLDAHGGAELAEVLASYREFFALREDLRRELAGLVASTQERLREQDALQFALDEIAGIQPTPDEDAQLAAEMARLQAVDELRVLAARADHALSGSYEEDFPGAVGLVGEARKAVNQIGELDSNNELLTLAREANDVLAEFASEIASYLGELDADPIRLDYLAGRQAQLQQLKRKYGPTLDEVLAWAKNSAERLFSLSTSDERIVELTAELNTVETELTERAGKLTSLRTQSASELGEKIQEELAALAMPNARIVFQLRTLPELGAHGAEAVQLLLAANPGAEPAPLGKVASGGELSRIRLAIEVVLADQSVGQTFVFDEVDAGVGGAVALEIGRRLARLARTAQVIVVTHLAQVAAFADRQFVVMKASDDAITTSDVIEVTGEERLKELARMMSGIDGVAGIESARELLAIARK